MTKRSKLVPFCAFLFAFTAWLGVAAADTIVQVPLPGLLDGRTVATLTGGKVVPWTLGTGVDGGGSGNGYMTQAASMSLGQNVKALPNDGKFPMDARHPDVELHFSNDADATSPQTHPVKGATGFMFDVPNATYSKLFLFMTSAEGSSSIKVTLTYADTSEMINVTVPDYFNDVAATDPVVFILYGNMAKWGQNNNVAEQNHHNLDGIELHPMAGKTLQSVRVDKTANGYLVFWGATGIATSAVTTGTGGSGGGGGMGGATDGGAAGADAGGGAAGAGGATGAAGSTTGAAGSTTGAAGSTTGAAGSTTGAAGSTTGAAGSTTGAAGSTMGTGTGAAGTGASGTGAAGTGAPQRSSSSGGCAVAGASARDGAAWLALLAACAWLGARRRRR
jgi:hypothetical protein